MLEIIAVILALLIAAVVIVLALAAPKPDTFTYVRNTRVNAPPEKIAPLVREFRKWRAWSPYEDRDPELKRTFGGSDSGVGATYAWEGDKNVGSGRMEILESTPAKVRIKLDFFPSFKASNIAEFSFTPQAGAAEVAWAMTG